MSLHKVLTWWLAPLEELNTNPPEGVTIEEANDFKRCETQDAAAELGC